MAGIRIRIRIREEPVYLSKTLSLRKRRGQKQKESQRKADVTNEVTFFFSRPFLLRVGLCCCGRRSTAHILRTIRHMPLGEW